jgi:hypothetical protein
MRVQHTPRDESLPHQIVLLRGPTAGSGDVSCNCLKLTSSGGYRPMGTVPFGDMKQAWALYDNPANHNNRDRPEFVPGERAPKEWMELW